MADVLGCIRQLIEDEWPEIDVTQITPESRLDTMGLDSPQLVELLLGLQAELDVSMFDEDLEGWRTVQDVINYLNDRCPTEGRPNMRRVMPAAGFAQSSAKALPGLTRVDRFGGIMPREWTRWQVGETTAESLVLRPGTDDWWPTGRTRQYVRVDRICWHLPGIPGAPATITAEQAVPPKLLVGVPDDQPFPEEWGPGLTVRHRGAGWSGVVEAVDWTKPNGPIVVHRPGGNLRGWSPTQLLIERRCNNMRTYHLLTGNSGTVDACNQYPDREDGWELQAEVDEDGKIGQTRARIINPDGKTLGSIDLSRHDARWEMLQLIRRDHLAYESACCETNESIEHSPAEITFYLVTTGNERAAAVLKGIKGAGWELNAQQLPGVPADHVQLLHNQRVLGNIDVEPESTLAHRVGTAILEHLRQPAGQAAAPESPADDAPVVPPLICIRTMPTGSIMVSLWLSGEEFKSLLSRYGPEDSAVVPKGPEVMTEVWAVVNRWKAKHAGAQVDSEVSLVDLAHAEAEAEATAGAEVADGAQTSQPEVVACAACGRLHHALWPVEGAKPLPDGHAARRCDNCRNATFVLPAEPVKRKVYHQVINPQLVSETVGQTAGAEPAKAAPAEAVESARQERRVGQALQQAENRAPPAVDPGGEDPAVTMKRLLDEKLVLEGVLKDGRNFLGQKLPEWELQERQRRLEEIKQELASLMQPGQNSPPAETPAQVQRLATEPLLRLPLGSLGHFPGGNQRTTFDQVKLEGLAASIRAAKDVLEPLLVTEQNGQYTLVAGERRLRAAKMAGLVDVPCRVISADEAQALAAMAAENLQREDLSPIDEARAYKRMLQVLTSQGDVADAVGMSRSHVNEYLQLLELPANLQHQVAIGDLGVQAARAFLGQTKDAPEPVKAKVAQTLVDQKPSIRQAPAVIDRVLEQEGAARAAGPAKAPPSTKTPPPSTPEPEPSTAPPAAAPQKPEPKVDLHAERAKTLAEIGRKHWEFKAGEGTMLFGRECYLPLERVLRHWDLRQDIGANSLPASFGIMKVTIPEQRIWMRTGEPQVPYTPPYAHKEVSGRPGQKAIEVKGSDLTIRFGHDYGGGEVAAVYSGNPVYFRVELWKASSGGQKTIESQMVIQDGGRHIVITGGGTAMIRQELVPQLEELVNELPALPEW
ncbi:MAG TPA: ParB/RepB/Spo0J family partition protein [Symbiobacteriaceae bacterium]|jgi:acyl carrier protein